jgi:RimJ/RimL family protein N-acetyltransferase
MTTNVIIREANIHDTQGLIDLKMNYLKDSKTIPLNLDEYRNDYDSEFNQIDTLNQQKNSLLLVAVLDKQIIGNLDIFGNQRQRLYHTGMLGMGIHNDFQNKGVGSKLMQATIDWGKQNEFIKLLTLEVYASNQSAIHLYEKFGFEQSGQVNNFFYQDGRYFDKLGMVNHL